MLNALLFAALAQAPLILGGLIVYWVRVPQRSLACWPVSAPAP